MMLWLNYYLIRMTECGSKITSDEAITGMAGLRRRMRSSQ